MMNFFPYRWTSSSPSCTSSSPRPSPSCRWSPSRSRPPSAWPWSWQHFRSIGSSSPGPTSQPGSPSTPTTWPWLSRSWSWLYPRINHIRLNSFKSWKQWNSSRLWLHYGTAVFCSATVSNQFLNMLLLYSPLKGSKMPNYSWDYRTLHSLGLG